LVWIIRKVTVSTYEEGVELSRNIHGDGEHGSNLVGDGQGLLKQRV